MRLLLVDDNTLYLEGLRYFLLENGIEVVGTAVDGLDALNKVEMLRPEMVLMDVEMSVCGGIEATRMIKRDYPGTEIVMLSISEEDEHLFSAIRAGASGYLLKSMEPQLFLAELRRLAEGDAPLAPGLTRRILQKLATHEQSEAAMESVALAAISPAEADLTDRQLAVLRLVAQGRTYREIGQELDIREITVRYHVNEVIRKLHLENRAQLIAYASRQKI